MLWNNACCGHVLDAINVLMYFVAVKLSFQLLAKHSLAALPCKRIVSLTEDKCIRSPMHSLLDKVQLIRL